MRKPTAVDSNDANVNEALTDTAQAAEASVVKGGSQDEGDREDEVVHADVTDDRQPPEDLGPVHTKPISWRNRKGLVQFGLPSTRSRRIR